MLGTVRLKSPSITKPSTSGRKVVINRSGVNTSLDTAPELSLRKTTKVWCRVLSTSMQSKRHKVSSSLGLLKAPKVKKEMQ